LTSGPALVLLTLHRPCVPSCRRTPGPYILVGHFVGGLLVRLYSDRYPNDVVGVVMVDPTDESFRGNVKESDPALGSHSRRSSAQ
jgi:pimeloyl-ACP methyl ester carboxylesterase